MKNYNIVDTGLTFKGHPVLLGSDRFGRSADKCTLACLDRFLENNLPENIICYLSNYGIKNIIDWENHND